MAFDALNILRGLYGDVLVDLDSAEVVAISTTVNTDGAKCLDLKETGARGLSAVMTLPSAPTTYQNKLTAIIQASDALAGNWETIADFPVLYSYLRRVPVKATVAAAVEADVGKKLTESAGTLDSGVIVHIDPALYALNGTGYILVAMDDAGDIFAGPAEALIATGGTFSGVETAAADVPAGLQHGPGDYVVKFATDKRYVRGKYTAVATNWGKVQVLVSPYPFKTL